MSKDTVDCVALTSFMIYVLSDSNHQMPKQENHITLTGSYENYPTSMVSFADRINHTIVYQASFYSSGDSALKPIHRSKP